MIENPQRQVILIVVVALVALFLCWSEEPNLGLDLEGGTQLVYELPIEEAIKQNQLDEDADPQAVIQQTLAIIGNRIDPTGVREAVITQRGDRQFMVELPRVTRAEAQLIKSQIQNLGKLEMRALAEDTYAKDGVQFDLAEETRRLQEWMDKDAADGRTNRERLAEDPHHIQQFNTLPATNGGRQNQEHFLWYAAQVLPSMRDPSRWDLAFSQHPQRTWNVVAAFTPAEFAAAPPAAEGNQKPFLVELYPINLHEVHFTGEDMDANAVRAGPHPETGAPSVYYGLTGTKQTDYADFSEEYIGKPSAIILNQLVQSAPSFQGRIFGNGIIQGQFTNPEAQALAKVIRTGSLKVKPVPISDRTIGPTLGAKSIELGQISIAVGGALVLMFILAYYRLAGLVAFVGLALNVFLIYAAVLFIRATITLPGIAGLVLTMGMAVDANILIYERIREELARGKDLLRAGRAGFDRAMVTILDANVTTFIAGVVLYNVGVGPVRGFAVTLMIGILTTLFTAFFVSRVVFHYMIEREVLKSFQVAGWFDRLRFDFVRAGKVAFSLSVVAVLVGLAVTLWVPADRKLGLDFMGGAAMELSLAEPQTARGLEQRLLDDDEFRSEFPNPLVATIDDVDEAGQSRSFSVKVKLSEAMRDRVTAEKAAALEAGEDYEPFYKRQLKELLAPVLVADAFSHAESVEVPGGALEEAEVHVHFTSPVEVEAARQLLVQRVSEAATVAPLDDPEATQTDALLVNFPVTPGTPPTQLTADVTEALDGLQDTAGNEVALSEPIPNAEDISPRMVGQLRMSAIAAMLISLFLIVMYIRIRFHEYKYGFAAVAALVHDVTITLSVVVLFNYLGLVNAEIDLAMIAAFLTIIGYSINDTIVIFDRIRENVMDNERLGESRESFGDLINRSINQTLSRTILTSGTTLFVVLAQFLVNRGSGSALEGFSFAMLVGILLGTYSTMFIASPVVLWLRNRESGGSAATGADPVSNPTASVPANA